MDLKVKSFIQSKLVFANNANFVFLIIDLYYLIFVIIALFSPIVELIVPLKILTKETKTEMKIHTETATTEIRKFSM